MFFSDTIKSINAWRRYFTVVKNHLSPSAVADKGKTGHCRRERGGLHNLKHLAWKMLTRRRRNNLLIGRADEKECRAPVRNVRAGLMTISLF